MSTWEDYRDQALRHRDRSLLALDFDGTISPIVDDPASAAPDPGVTEQLARISAHLRVAIISGRPKEFLREVLGEYGFDLIGNYGKAEKLDDDETRLLGSLANQAIATFGDGIELEIKPTSLGLHYRKSPELAKEIASWAADQADRQSNLEILHGKQVVEVAIGEPKDKGSALNSLLDDRTVAAAYFGDDLADIPAFRAVIEIAPVGYRCAIGSMELPDELFLEVDEIITRRKMTERLREFADLLEEEP